MRFDTRQPPVSAEFEHMSGREARAYLDWYVSEIPRRVAELRRALDETSGSGVPLDFTPLSLQDLGGWVDGHADLLWRWMSEAECRTGIHYLCADVGIYLAETLRERHPALHWGIQRRPRRFIYLNQPLLLGFRGVAFIGEQTCIGVAHRVAERVWKAKEELPRLFWEWDAMAPD